MTQVQSAAGKCRCTPARIAPPLGGARVEHGLRRAFGRWETSRLDCGCSDSTEGHLRAFSATDICLIAALIVCVSACLPPPRPNDPLPDAAGAVDAEADGTEPDAGADIKTAEDSGPKDTATVQDTADLPQGCTVDVDCAAKPAAECKVWRCNPTTGACDVNANAKVNASCDDDNPCTSSDACDASGQCAFGKPAECDDKNPCTADTCDQQKGGCVYLNKVDAPCDDGDSCTGKGNSDKCVDGTCSGSPVVCTSAGACKDWACNPKSGECVGTVIEKENVECDDGNLCTTKDTCQKTGACIGEQWNKTGQCDDNNACSNDKCNPLTGCFSTEVVGESDECTNDGDQCVVAGCTKGKCVKSAKVDCSDKGSACSDAKCDPGSGQCNYTDKADGSKCEDTGKCVSAECVSGVCADKATVLNCDDGNACTNDSCKKGSGSDAGCQNTANTTACADGSACTTQDKCKDGACGGTVKDCSDSNECTVDACDPIAGDCSHSNAADGTTCTGGSCAAGTCK